MGLRRKKEKQNTTPVQTAAHTGNTYPFYLFDQYTPLAAGEYKLYQTLKEAIPIIDAAIGKIIRLIGEFAITCENRQLEKEINYFLQTVQVGSTGNGACCFVCGFLEQLITYGTAVAEIVPNAQGTNIQALYQADLEHIKLSARENPLNVTVHRQVASGYEPVPYQQLMLVSALHPQPGEIYGTSMLKGLPFVSSILLKIIHSIGKNWERVGNVRFAVTYKPNGENDHLYTKDRAMQIAKEWSKAMREDGGVSDFVSVGDVDIKAIGADNQVLDAQVPARLILEQIVSKLSIPPFLLGLSWSSTERMSSQQADILTSELEYYRHLLNPVIRKICTMWMHLQGRQEKFDITWNNINLQDEVELANARLISAQAEQIEQGTGGEE